MSRRYFIFRTTLWSLALLLLFTVSPSSAASTVECHCFRDRSFSAENPQAFDPYLLATTQNRLLAHAFGIERKQIVKLKMAGARGDFLWVAYWVARIAEVPVDDVEALYERELSWRKVVQSLKPDPEELGSAFVGALRDDNEGILAWAVVRQVCEKGFAASGEEFFVLRKAGASLQEAILTSVLAAMQQKEAILLFRKARQVRSWGRLVIDSGVTLEAIEAYLKKALPGW